MLGIVFILVMFSECCNWIQLLFSLMIKIFWEGNCFVHSCSSYLDTVIAVVRLEINGSGIISASSLFKFICL